VSSPETISKKRRISKVIYFFPFQLILLQIKKNFLLIIFWLVLFGFIFNGIGSKYGVSHLFLYPEYNGVNGLLAFGILGFSFGGFIVSYNLYTYIIHSHRFPFIATLDKPLRKFSINNFILPLFFVLCYIWQSFTYQTSDELVPTIMAVGNLIGFLGGMSIMMAFSFFYFHLTNKNVNYFDANKKDKTKEAEPLDDAFASSALQRKTAWQEEEERTLDWRIDSYLNSAWKIKVARSSSHYPREVLEKVFSQHHVNASFFELLVFISFLLISLFRENPVFEIPAAASAVLFFTILIMVFSAIYSWLRGWTAVLIVGLFFLLNTSSTLSNFLNLETHVYGLSYEHKGDYHEISKETSVQLSDFNHSKAEGINVLNNWKSEQKEEKPPLVIVCVSGGGLRAALWSMNSLCYADSSLNGELMPRVQLLTGSSGGMLGASYLRELYLRGELNGNRTQLYDNVSSDILNPTILALTTHDLSFRFRSKEVHGKNYLMDRAYSFEEQLHEVTGGVLDKTLQDYYLPEYRAEVPMMIFSPVLNLDGRRLMIASQNIDYLCYNEADELGENISYQRIFRQNNPLNTRFSSVIRMNATFPYILPASTLPFDSSIKVADAGLRDNFGMRTALNYIEVFKTWIEENTSQVIILEIRDTERLMEKKPSEKSILSEFTSPLGGVYANVIQNQDYENELHFNLVNDDFQIPVQRVSLELKSQKGKEVALSWHLTNLEKKTILESSGTSSFQEAILSLQSYLSNQ